MKYFFTLALLCCGSMLSAQFGGGVIPAPAPPTISVTQGANSVAKNGTVNVSYADTVASLAFQISINDINGDNVWVATTISNSGSTGIQTSEWSSSLQPVAYTLSPSSGTFNTTSGVTHQVSITAQDSTARQRVFTFEIVQAPQTGGNTLPSIMVLLDASSTNPVAIPSGYTMNVPYNRTVAAEDFDVVINDADNDNTSCATTITNLGSSGILESEWSSSSAAVSYTLSPTTGTFNTPAGVTHVVTITADDGTDTTVFVFNITQAAQPVNAAPAVDISMGTMVIGNGGTVNVSYLDTVSALMNFSMVISDADNDNTSCTTTITNLGSTGMLESEWTSASAAVSYTLSPATGTFNTIAGVTHVVTTVVDDGTDTTTHVFNIVQAAQPGPEVAVSDGATVSNGAAAAGSTREFGQQDIANGPTANVIITVSNTAAAGSADLNPGTPSLTGSSSGEFVLDVTGFPATIAPGGTATFTVAFDPNNTGSFTANVEFTHDDTSTSTPFSFEITGIGTTPTPAPILTVRDTDQNGVVISNGSAASGSRAFGTVQNTNIPTANNTVYIKNDGNANMTLVLPTLSGSGFTLDTSNFQTLLTPGAFCTIGFALTEITGGSYNATISFGHDDSSTTTPFSFDLAATVGDGSIGSGGGGSGCAAATSHTALWTIFALLGTAALLYRRRKTV